jgi:hypothetical protein
LTTELEDVELQGIESPSFITCEANPSPVVVAQNIGTKPISSLTVAYTVNGVTNQFTVNDLNVGLGDEIRIQLPSIVLSPENNSLDITLLSPNGQPDQSPSNNTKVFTIVLDQTVDRIPLRQNFDSGFENWKVYNPDGGENWELTNTNFAGSVYFSAHNNPSINEVSWLVSPVLDFSLAREASIVFDYAYRFKSGRAETLKLYGSKDCGNSFEEIGNITLPSEEFQSAWAPVNVEDWVKDFIVDLSSYAGEPNVRIAFAVVNDNGNNLFIDNIEFFTSANPILTEAETPYNVYGYDAGQPARSDLKITFNLPQRLDVEYTIVDMMGRVHGDGKLYDVLNQTFELDEGDKLATGTYIIRLNFGQQSYSERFLIVR